MSKALVIIAVLLSCLLNAQGASVLPSITQSGTVSNTVSITTSNTVSITTSNTVSITTSNTVSITNSISVSWTTSISTSWSVSNSVSNSVSASVSNSVSNSVSPSVSPTPASTNEANAPVPSLTNTCAGQSTIICLQWSGVTSLTRNFIVKVGSLQFTYPNTQRAVNLVGLSASTAYSISIYAIDNEGIHTAATTIQVTTGAPTVKSDPKSLGPVPASLVCEQVGTTAAVKASWNVVGRPTPSRYNLQINCRGIRNRKLFVKGSTAGSVTVSGIFGKGLPSESRPCKCRLRAFYDKPVSRDQAKFRVPLLADDFTIAT